MKLQVWEVKIMTKIDNETCLMIEQLKKLPENVQERIAYIIQGALLVQQK